LITILVAFAGLTLIQPAIEIAVLLSFRLAFPVAVLVLVLVLIFVLTAVATSRLIALPETSAGTAASSAHGCICRSKTTSLRTTIVPAFTRLNTAGCCDHSDCNQNAAEYVPGLFNIHVIFPL
jgi:hypothetical protein